MCYINVTHRPGSGSFVRPKKILGGITFLEALKERYISGGIGDDDEMFVVDKDSNTTKVYMVGAEKIAGKLRYAGVYESVAYNYNINGYLV